MTQIELGCQLATMIFQLVWATVAPSLWTLAGGWLFGAALKVVLTHIALPGPPNRFQWDRDAFKEIFDFGKWVFVSSSASFFHTFDHFSNCRVCWSRCMFSRTSPLFRN